MKFTLKNRPNPWLESAADINEWFEGFEKRQRDILSQFQFITIASYNADSVITLGDTKFELSRSERYGIILYIRKEILGE